MDYYMLDAAQYSAQRGICLMLLFETDEVAAISSQATPLDEMMLVISTQLITTLWGADD